MTEKVHISKMAIKELAYLTHAS